MSITMGSLTLVVVIIAVCVACCYRRFNKIVNGRHQKMNVLKSCVPFSGSSSSRASRGPSTSTAYTLERMPLNKIHVVENSHYFTKTKYSEAACKITLSNFSIQYRFKTFSLNNVFRFCNFALVRK